MTKFFLLLALLLCPPILAQTPEPTPQAGINKINPPIYWENLFNYQALPVRIREVDGSPNIASVATIVVPNGSLAQSGQTATLTYAVTSGTPGGSNTQVQYNNAGAFGGISGATSDGTNMTFGSGNLRATSPRITTSILDANGNIHLALTATGSAVNYLTYANSAAGGNPTLTATGSDTDIGARFAGKGSGFFGFTPASSLSTTVTITHSDATPRVQIGTLTGDATQGSIYFGNLTPTSTNYAMRGDGGQLLLNANSAVYLTHAGVSKFQVTSSANRTPSSWHYAWTSSSTDANGTADTGFIRLAAGVIRTSNASTGQGSFCVGCTSTVGSIGTSGTGVLALSGSTAPSSSPADTVQAYSNDAAAGAHELYTRNEAGEVNRLTGLSARNSAQFDITSSTTLTNVTGLSRNVEANRVYAFYAYLQTTANVAGGIKFSVSGTATATAISYEGTLQAAAALVAQTRATALDTTVCASTTTTVGTCVINGVIQVNAAGTLTIAFAQNASNGAASSVLANQSFQLTPIN